MSTARKRFSMKRISLGGAAVLLAVAAGFTGTAGANLPGSTFEGNDGNFVVNTTGNTDWVNVHGGVTTGVDLATGQTDNSFGNGTKESDVNVTVGTGSIPNSKADLGNFYVASETLANNHVLLYLGWTRVNTSGTTNFDFEINQEEQPDLTTPGPKQLVRTAGDIIINYDFQGGAQKPTLAFRTWLANGTWSDATPLTGTTGEAEVNRVSLANPLAVAPSPATAPAFTFGEAAIDLTAAGIIAEGDCAPFSSAYVKSRASDSFTSAVKDFIAPVGVSLDTCGTIIVEKVTVPSPDPTDTSFSYTSNFNGNFSLKDGESATKSGLTPGNAYSVSEADPGPNFVLTSATCDDGSDPSAIDLGPSETVTCTFTNTLQIGAIKIHKDRKHAADGPGDHPHSGVEFTVNGNSVGTTDANGDLCVDGLLFGTYTVHEVTPAGYQGEADKSVTVDNVAFCTDIPYVGETVSFHNTPLTNLSVSVDSQVPGGTSSTIDCVVATAGPGDDITASANDLVPGTYTCTIVIDP